MNPGVRRAAARDARAGVRRAGIGDARCRPTRSTSSGSSTTTAINGRLSVYGQGGNDFFAVRRQQRDHDARRRRGQRHLPDRPDLRPRSATRRHADGTTATRAAARSRRRTHSRTVATTRGWLSARQQLAAARRGRHRRRRLHRLLEPGAAAARGRRRQRPVHRPRLRARADDDELGTGADCDSTRSTAPTMRDRLDRDPADQVAMPKLTSGFSTAAQTDIRTGGGNNQVAVQRQRAGLDRRRQRHRQGRRPRHRVRRPLRRHVEGDLRGRPRGHATRTSSCSRSTASRATTRSTSSDAAGRRHARHRRARQRHDQRRRRRRRRRRLARRRGHERHRQPRRHAPATRSTTASSPTASTSASRAPNQGQVIIKESDGFTDIREGGRLDTYTSTSRSRLQRIRGGLQVYDRLRGVVAGAGRRRRSRPRRGRRRSPSATRSLAAQEAARRRRTLQGPGGNRRLGRYRSSELGAAYYGDTFLVSTSAGRLLPHGLRRRRRPSCRSARSCSSSTASNWNAPQTVYV